MIVGNGQLAKVFKNSDLQDTCIFASGVSNSGCTSASEFQREADLLISTLKENGDKKFVYFSSCALSAQDYPKNNYYKHKENMEQLIKAHSSQYYIFRIPQLFGDLILHKTLINFIYKAIEHNHHFNVYSEAYRYVIEINDVKQIVESFLKYHSTSSICMDIGNPYRYSVLEIVSILESLLKKKAKFNLIDQSDQYELDFQTMKRFIKQYGVNIDFHQDYLLNKLINNLIETNKP